MHVRTGEEHYDIIKRSDLTVVNDGDRIVIDGIVEGQPTIIYINKSLKKIIFRINTKTSILNVTIYNKILFVLKIIVRI